MFLVPNENLYWVNVYGFAFRYNRVWLCYQIRNNESIFTHFCFKQTYLPCLQLSCLGTVNSFEFVFKCLHLTSILFCELSFGHEGMGGGRMGAPDCGTWWDTCKAIVVLFHFYLSFVILVKTSLNDIKYTETVKRTVIKQKIKVLLCRMWQMQIFARNMVVWMLKKLASSKSTFNSIDTPMNRPQKNPIFAKSLSSVLKYVRTGERSSWTQKDQSKQKNENFLFLKKIEQKMSCDCIVSNLLKILWLCTICQDRKKNFIFSIYSEQNSGHLIYHIFRICRCFFPSINILYFWWSLFAFAKNGYVCHINSHFLACLFENSYLLVLKA